MPSRTYEVGRHGPPPLTARKIDDTVEASKMTDKDTTPESTAEVSEQQAPPAPKLPSVPSTAAPSAAGLDAEALVAQLTERLSSVIDEKINRSFQSAKDRRFSDVERIHKYLQASGGDVAKATRDLQMDELYEQVTSGKAVGAAPAGNEGDKAYMEAKTAQLLQGAGIDFEDPDYKLLVAQYAGRISNPSQWTDVVQTFADQRVSKREKSERITGAAAVSEHGRSVVTPPDTELGALTAELAKLGAQRPTAEIMAKRRELRLKIGAIQDKMGLVLGVDKT